MKIQNKIQHFMTERAGERGFRARILTFFFLVLSPFMLQAAEVRFFLDSPETYPGMAQQLHLRISGSKAVDRPELPEVKGLTFREAGQSHYEQRSIGNGGSHKTVTMEYTWLVTAMKAGNYRIPPLSLKVGDERLNTNALTLAIKEPGPVEGCKLILGVEGNTVFPGIPVILTLKWLFSSEVSRPDFNLPFLSNPDLKVEDLPPPSSSTSDIYQFDMGGRRLYGVQSAEIYEGKQYASLSMSWNIFPLKTGTLHLDPVYLSFQRTVKDSYGRKRRLPTVIPSNALDLKVRNLPAALSSFPGGILVARDELQIGASLDQNRVYPGDPLVLTLSFRGLVSPALTEYKGAGELPEAQGIFRADGASLRVVSGEEEEKQGIKSYAQDIRMLKAGLNSFPSLSFPYYSMKQGKVLQAKTKALELEVLVLDEGAFAAGKTSGEDSPVQAAMEKAVPPEGLPWGDVSAGSFGKFRTALAGHVWKILAFLLFAAAAVLILKKLKEGGLPVLSPKGRLVKELNRLTKGLKKCPEARKLQALADFMERNLSREPEVNVLLQRIEKMLWAGESSGQEIGAEALEEIIRESQSLKSHLVSKESLKLKSSFDWVGILNILLFLLLAFMLFFFGGRSRALPGGSLCFNQANVLFDEGQVEKALALYSLASAMEPGRGEFQANKEAAAKSIGLNPVKGGWKEILLKAPLYLPGGLGIFKILILLLGLIVLAFVLLQAFGGLRFGRGRAKRRIPLLLGIFCLFTLYGGVQEKRLGSLAVAAPGEQSLRSGDSPMHPAVETLEGGEELRILKENTHWLKVESLKSGRQGWMEQSRVIRPENLWPFASGVPAGEG